jgi:hypothetical protein
MLGTLLSWLTGGFVDKLVGLGQAYINKSVTEAQYRAEVEKATQDAARQIEAAWADASSKIAASTQDALKASPILQRAWSAVLFLQVAVLVFYQVGAPAFQVITGTAWPDPGVTLEWCYLLIGAQLGAGPLVFRRGR